MSDLLVQMDSLDQPANLCGLCSPVSEGLGNCEVLPVTWYTGLPCWSVVQVQKGWATVKFFKWVGVPGSPVDLWWRACDHRAGAWRAVVLYLSVSVFVLCIGFVLCVGFVHCIVLMYKFQKIWMYMYLCCIVIVVSISQAKRERNAMHEEPSSYDRLKNCQILLFCAKWAFFQACLHIA